MLSVASKIRYFQLSINVIDTSGEYRIEIRYLLFSIYRVDTSVGHHIVRSIFPTLESIRTSVEYRVERSIFPTFDISYRRYNSV